MAEQLDKILPQIKRLKRIEAAARIVVAEWFKANGEEDALQAPEEMYWAIDNLHQVLKEDG